MKRAILLGAMGVLVLMCTASMVTAVNNVGAPLAGAYQPDPVYVPSLSNTITIDGRIATGEYTGAAYATPNGEAHIYTLYTATYLYVGVDFVLDVDREAKDAMMLFIDVNHDNNNDVFGNENMPYPRPLSPTPYPQGGVDCGIIAYFTTSMFLVETATFEARGVCIDHSGANSWWGTSNKSGTSHRQYEFRIDLHLLPAVNTQFPVGIWGGDYDATPFIFSASRDNHIMTTDSCHATISWFYASDANSDVNDCFDWTAHVTTSSLDHWMLYKPYAPDPSAETPVYVADLVEVRKTTDAKMTFDGRIVHDEYYGSNYIAFTVPARCGLAQGNVYIYSVYTSNYVYIGVDAAYDRTNNASWEDHFEDALKVYVDYNQDGVLDFHPHSFSPIGDDPMVGEVDSEWYTNTTTLFDYGLAYDLADSNTSTRFDDSNKSANNHRQWELRASILAFPDVGENFGVGIWGIANYCNWGGRYIINHTDYAPYQYPLAMLNDSGNWTNETEDNLNVSAFGNWTLIEDNILPPGEHGEHEATPPTERPLVEPRYYSSEMVALYGTFILFGAASVLILFKGFALTAAQYTATVATAGITLMVLVLGFATGYFHL